MTTGEHIETWAHIQTTFTIQFFILRIYRSSSFVLRSFVHKQRLDHALTWRRSGAKSILEPVTTRNYDASRSLQATFSDNSFSVQVTIIHPICYIDQTSKARKWCIILKDTFLYLLFKHRKGAVVTHMIHKIIIDFTPVHLLALDLWLEWANGGRHCFLCLISCSWNVSFVIKKSAKKIGKSWWWYLYKNIKAECMYSLGKFSMFSDWNIGMVWSYLPYPVICRTTRFWSFIKVQEQMRRCFPIQ